MDSSELKRRLRAGERAYGTLIVSPSPRWPDMVAKLGLDFVFIDTEHIAIDRDRLSWMCQTYRGLGLPPLVRIPSPDPYQACMVLDGGAAGVIAPYLETADPSAPWPEYPRPQMVRNPWSNLNGRWEYAVTARDAPAPERYDGQILVPFAIQSALSGVKRAVGPGERLWYRRTFPTPNLAGGRHLLLNFGAVNWQADVLVNGRLLRRHRGGYDPFAIDITAALRPGAVQEIAVAVENPVDTGVQPRGKQVLAPNSIWYTAVTGIWQTVWLETVPPHHVRRLSLTPNLDRGEVSVRFWSEGSSASELTVDIAVLAQGETIAHAQAPRGNGMITLALPHPRAWSPDDPYLYQVRVTERAPDGTDEVTGYFGLRQVEVRRADDGYERIFLNHRPIFGLGPLDQGWWPDGLYTAPTDAALRADVATMRQMGFNLVRKHVKVEPARWYYHCDQLGLLVWQDMPSAFRTDDPAQQLHRNESADGSFEPKDDAQFRRELSGLVENFGVFPSIIAWVPFNEGWGQPRFPPRSSRATPRRCERRSPAPGRCPCPAPSS